jgi:hypothetical protein
MAEAALAIETVQMAQQGVGSADAPGERGRAMEG